VRRTDDPISGTEVRADAEAIQQSCGFSVTYLLQEEATALVRSMSAFDAVDGSSTGT
jgi:hypothetical protein